MKKTGWGFLILGGVTVVAETAAKSEAQNNNVPFNQTTFGAIAAPIEQILPFSLGWSLVLVGAGILILIPLIKGA